MSYLVLNRHPNPEAGYLYDVVHACTGESTRDWSYSYACRIAEYENAFRESEPACDFYRCQGYVVFRGHHELCRSRHPTRLDTRASRCYAVRWRGSPTVEAPDSGSGQCGFESLPRHSGRCSPIGRRRLHEAQDSRGSNPLGGICPCSPTR